VRATRAVGAREPVAPAAERALAAQQAAVARAQERAAGARQERARGARQERAGRPPAGEGQGARRAPRPPPPAVVRAVDVDRASAAELETLPRVGPVLARRIVADRDSLGPFGSLAGLGRVKGVGDAMLRALAAHVTFSGTPRPMSAARAAPPRPGSP
jgi:competence protein ComEA